MGSCATNCERVFGAIKSKCAENKQHNPPVFQVNARYTLVNVRLMVWHIKKTNERSFTELWYQAGSHQLKAMLVYLGAKNLPETQPAARSQKTQKDEHKAQHKASTANKEANKCLHRCYCQKTPIPTIYWPFLRLIQGFHHIPTSHASAFQEKKTTTKTPQICLCDEVGD